MIGALGAATLAVTLLSAADAPPAAAPPPATPQQAYPPPAYPQQAYPPPAYPQQAYPPGYAYPPYGYPPPGYQPYAYPPPARPSPEEEYPTRRWGFFLSPLDALRFNAMAEGSVAIAGPLVLNLHGGYVNRGVYFTFSDASGTTVQHGQGAAVGAGLQLFASQKAFHHWYFLPDTQYLHTWATGAYMTVLTFSLKVGYQWTFQRGFSIRLGGGGAYHKVKLVGHDLDLSGTILFPTLEFLLGWTI